MDSSMSNSELPSNLAIRKVSPKIWLPSITVTWGIITMCLGFVQNFGGFVAVRALLGAAEGGLLPGSVRRLHWHVLLNYLPDFLEGSLPVLLL